MARANPTPHKPRNERSKKVSEATPSRRGGWLRLLIACVLVMIVVCGVLWLHYTNFTARLVVPDGEVKTVIIPHDTSWPDVIKTLSQQGVIAHPRYFDFWGRRRDLPAHVKAGTYRLDGPVTLDALDEMLRKGGQTDGVSVTIPEGFTIFHVADRLERLGLANRDDFLRAARSEELLQQYDVPGESFEGYLFPDTYRIKQGTTVEEIIARFHQRWSEVVEDLIAAHPEALDAHVDVRGMGLHELIVLASLVERETNHDPERALIARVFLNRIDKNMRLQTDPTCVYGELTYREIPKPKYCKDRLNRYSTYVIDGLPPGPISNPGRKSIEAALAPATSEAARSYLFFVARRDGSGAHHFTATFKEHRSAINKFLR